MASKKENIEILIKEDINKMGYDLEYVENICENKENILRVVIDKKGTITTEDCEKVSRAIENKIDNLVNYSNGYVLEVSSPGLERKLVNKELYNKYLGFKIKIKLYDKLHDKKELTGVLDEVNENGIILKLADEKVSINFQNIACGNTVYDF